MTRTATKQRSQRRMPRGVLSDDFKPLLAHTYQDKNEIDVREYWASEKYDGFRAIWNGRAFISRTNKVFEVPEWFAAIMPKGKALDGELWMGRGNIARCGVFNRKTPDDKEWKHAKYMVFDIISTSKVRECTFEERMKMLKGVE